MASRTRTLQSLIRLRKTEVDEAKSTLAQALANEEAARQHLESLQASIAAEQRAASAGQTSMDDFRRWLPTGQQAVTRAAEALHSVKAVSDQARDALMQVNAALKATESILEKRVEEEKTTRSRREQAEIDDLTPHVRRNAH
ncbi:flagellar export protein FliJ [Gluconacetobacter takamatsuzukensis]|nr:flagellar export protein FliJ [Gluconacetobacter takamatsuzukensis]